MNKEEWCKVATDLIADYTFAPAEKSRAELENLKLELYHHTVEAKRFDGTKVRMLRLSLEKAAKEITKWNAQELVKLNGNHRN